MRQSSAGGRRCDEAVSVVPASSNHVATPCAHFSKSLYRVQQLTAARANLRRIDTPPRSNYAVIEVVIPKNHFEKQHLRIELGKGESHVRLSARGTCDGLRAEQLCNARIDCPLCLRTRRAPGY